MADEPVHLREVLFEFIPVGKYIKVIAIDPHTRVEVTVAGDRKAPQKELQRIAIQKLQYVLRRRQGAAKNVPRTGTQGPTDFEA